MSGDAETRYETRDFYLAAFLRSAGLDLDDVRRHGARCTFVFRDHPERAHLVMAFVNNHPVQVYPQALVGAIKAIKALMYDGANARPA